MAIDGIICSIRKLKDGALELEIAPRVEPSGRFSIPGQDFITLMPPHTQEVFCGETIWGGAGHVMIGHKNYKRMGYTMIREANPTAEYLYQTQYAPDRPA